MNSNKGKFNYALSILTAFNNGETIEFRANGLSPWQRSSLHDEHSVTNNFHMHLLNNPNMYRIQPKKKIVPMEKNDFPSIFWIRRINNKDTNHLVSYMDNKGVIVHSTNDFTYEYLMKHFEYSATRRDDDWHPCEKEIY